MKVDGGVVRILSDPFTLELHAFPALLVQHPRLLSTLYISKQQGVRATDMATASHSFRYRTPRVRHASHTSSKKSSVILDLRTTSFLQVTVITLARCRS